MDDTALMLSDLIHVSKLEDSVALAHAVEEETLKTLKKRWKTVTSMGVKKAPFYVLIGARMPCILIELFFIDNEHDAALLRNRRFREELAEGIARGINRFLVTVHPKGET
jgi:N-acetylmuramoyl-L-alanine amidase